MENTRTLNCNLETMAWGAIFIWWGITEMVKFPTGIGTVGFGLILLGVNVVRSLNNIPTRGFSITVGIIALVWGGLELAEPALHLAFELPVFAILLIVLGGVLLTRELLRVGKTGFGNLR